jgi:hypothetical protein
MSRTSAELINAIIDVDSSISLTPFIAVANSLVTTHCADEDYTDAQLIEIETWLAAHFYTVREMLPAMEKADDVQVQYQYNIGKNLSSSHYGQTAMLLDFHGGLSLLNSSVESGTARRKISITHWG